MSGSARPVKWLSLNSGLVTAAEPFVVQGEVADRGSCDHHVPLPPDGRIRTPEGGKLPNPRCGTGDSDHPPESSVAAHAARSSLLGRVAWKVSLVEPPLLMPQVPGAFRRAGDPLPKPPVWHRVTQDGRMQGAC